MKLKERQALRAKSSSELTQLVRDAKKNQARTQLEMKLGKHTNAHVAKQIRHEIAIMKTLIKEQALKEIAK